MPDDEIGYWNFWDLVRLGFVRDRPDLSRRIKFQGFPKPYKAAPTQQGRAEYARSEVLDWDRNRKRLNRELRGTKTKAAARTE